MNLQDRIKNLSENELNLIKWLIFQYKNLETAKASDEMKRGYRYALHNAFLFLNILTEPNIDLRPAVEQQIEKITPIIEVIEKENAEK